MIQPGDITALKDATRAGRVSQTGFLEPDEAAQLVARLRQSDISVTVSGGYPGAKRRVLTVFPDSIPEATTPLIALYFEAVTDANELRVALRKYLDPTDIGDSISHQDGLSVIVLAKAKTRLPQLLVVSGQEQSFQELALERVVAGSTKRQQVIVPSLRVDTLGAKAFNVSRAYFAKGIEAANVTVNGKRAVKSSSAEPGDEIYAQGLGRIYLVSVQGETRRGNLKVIVDIEKA